MTPELFRNSVLGVLKQNLHFIKPASVVSVNYKDNSVEVKPLTTTRWKDGLIAETPIMKDVPLIVNYGNQGSAAITVPVKRGDTGLLLFSDRNYGGLLDEDLFSDPNHKYVLT